MILDLIVKYVQNSRISYKKGGTDPRNYRVSFNKINKILNFNVKIMAEDSIKKLVNSIDNGLFLIEN